MTVYTASRIVNAPQDTMFDLVADVERYPEFLPMWRSARITAQEENEYTTEQEIGFGFICERFHTRTVLIRPTQIEVTSTDGLFRNFFIRWDFEPRVKGSRIAIALSWSVRSRVLQSAIDLVLPETAGTMINAFEQRASDLSVKP
ncbi:MAG: type II toxin-antitoxin system RatA family toxin [Rhodospirillales bacterium]|nr:type II toxin-antitoxin system RatA family toxin [Rhodospirillales bacterium]